MQKLITYINSLTGMSAESWEALLPALTKKVFAKGELLLAAGEVCNSLFFIEEGFVRTYAVNDGKEVISALHFEEEVVTNVNSFSGSIASDYSIEACEPVTAIVVDKHKLHEAALKAPQITVLEKNCLNFTAARLDEHTELFELYTPTERYEYLARNKPYILQRVQPALLAAYLQLGRESFNRLRKRREVQNIQID